MMGRILGPFDALKVNALLHHLPQRGHLTKSKKITMQYSHYFIVKGKDGDSRHVYENALERFYTHSALNNTNV